MSGATVKRIFVKFLVMLGDLLDIGSTAEKESAWPEEVVYVCMDGHGLPGTPNQFDYDAVYLNGYEVKHAVQVSTGVGGFIRCIHDPYESPLLYGTLRGHVQLREKGSGRMVG